MDYAPVTLCFPDGMKSCFACCPPIRPTGYEHREYKNIIRRILRENTASFVREERSLIPITGFSCWALGYPDKGFRLVGCLLHPCRNDGIDLRYRVDYEGKCERESCPEAKTFSALGPSARTFWLPLADGLDSFSYSSRRINFLFKMMNWGPHLLNLISSAEGDGAYTSTSFLTAFPFFSTPLSPRAHAYLINRLIHAENLHLLKCIPFRNGFERFCTDLPAHLAENLSGRSDGSHVHLLPLERDFLDFVRLCLRINKMTEGDALVLREKVEREIEKARGSLIEGSWKRK